MRILIDLQGAQTSSRFRGIGRYSLDITKSILRNSEEHEVLILLSGILSDQIDTIRAELFDFIRQDRILVWEGVGPTAYASSQNEWRLKASELMREAYISSINPDVVLISSFFEGYSDDFAASIGLLNSKIPVAIIFYDLIPALYPSDYLSDSRYDAWYRQRLNSFKKANFLLAISSASKKEAIKYLGFDSDCVEIISSAVSDSFSEFSILKAISNFLSELGISKPFLMYTSATDARKNHLRLIEAYAKLNPAIRKMHQLVFAGGMPVEHQKKFRRYARQHGLGNNELIFTGELTNDEMKALYSECKAFVFPSWHEGFGLPILEAMQFNKAVIASDCSSIPEIISHADALFDPLNVDKISEKIALVLTDEGFRLSLEKNSMQRAKEFSWDKSAKLAITALKRLVSKYDVTGSIADSGIPQGPISKNILNNLVDRVAKINLPHDEMDLLSASQAISLNHRDVDKHQLLVDISVLVEQDAKTGIQRVVRNILREWLSHPPAGFTVEPVYANSDKPYRYARKFTTRFLNQASSETVVDDVVEFSNGDHFIGLDLLYPHLALKHKGFYQKMRNHGVRVRFIVYDLLPILLPQHVVPGASSAHSQWLRLVAQTDGAVCISQSVASELKDWLSRESIITPKSFEINSFHLGADPEQSPLNQKQDLEKDQAEALRLIASKPSFLSVGTLEPRKGHLQVLEAFEQLWSHGFDINLVFVGKQGWKVEGLVRKLLNHEEKGKHLFWFEGVNDLYLNKIYQSCSCLIAASEGEGFGLPLIEAAHHGIPIIARSIPVFHEVAGQNAFYFEGLLPQNLALAIRHWLTLAESKTQPDSKKMMWLSWAQSAKALEKALYLNQALNKQV